MYLWSEGIDSYPVLYDVLCLVSTVPRWPEKISPDLRAVPKRFVRQLWTRTVSLHEEDWCPRQPILIRVSSVSSISLYPILPLISQVSFQKLIQKHICTGRKLKNRDIWECWKHPHHFFLLCKKHVKAYMAYVACMYTGHLQQYFIVA